jgi:hypothetical protein
MIDEQAVDDNAVAAFRARAQLEWDEHDRILGESVDQGDMVVLFKYAQLLNLAYLTLFRRKFPAATRNDIIRYVADLRTRTPVLHPSEMNPRLVEEVIIAALRSVPVTTMTDQGYSPHALTTVVEFLMDASFADAGLDKAENFDQLMGELQPRLEALEIPADLPGQVDTLIEQLHVGTRRPGAEDAKPAE